MAALLAASIQAEQHARGIQAAIVRQPDLRGAHANVGPMLNRGQQGFEPARMRARVIVQDREKRRLRLMECLIHSRSKADVAIVRDDANALARFHLPPSAVIDHDHVKVAECLAVERSQAFVKRFVRGQSRNNHGHRWVDLAGYHLGSGAAAKPQANTYDRIVACTDIYYTFSWLLVSWRKRPGIWAKSASSPTAAKTPKPIGRRTDKRLIFQSTRDKLQCDQIFIMNRDGSDQHMVSTGKGRTTCGYFLAGQQAHSVCVDA